ncbi:MAG TPA: ATP phosphoribosyltransferase [bacterium]|nr:ATP phosphoribosyltransferase [bacterium]
MPVLKLALPKGSLQDMTFEIFRQAGYNITVGSRSYVMKFDDDTLEGWLFRAQEISRYVESGIVDAGITGHDWVLENNSKVKYVSDMLYAKSGTGKVRWVLAVPEHSKMKKPQDLEGKRVATELVQYTRKYFKKHQVNVDVEFSWGATEVKVPDVVDAIVDVTETGSSLRAHRLRIIDTVLESNTKFIANKDAWKDDWKRKKIEDLNLLIQGALAARTKVGLKMNLPKSSLAMISDMIPAMKSPTISPLNDEDWVALEYMVDKTIVREIIPALKKAGARDIIEYQLSKVIK